MVREYQLVLVVQHRIIVDRLYVITILNTMLFQAPLEPKLLKLFHQVMYLGMLMMTTLQLVIMGSSEQRELDIITVVDLILVDFLIIKYTMLFLIRIIIKQRSILIIIK